MKILCLTKRWRHHTKSGGYDRLAREVGAIEVRRYRFPRVLSKIIHLWRRFLFLNPFYILDYRYEDLLAERKLLIMAGNISPDVVHVLYGDEQLNLLLRRHQSLSCPLVVSFHLPTHRAAERLNALGKERLSRINGVILLSTYQLQDYRTWFRANQLFYVPHGMDTKRFSPGARHTFSQELKLLTVGNHMRDWKTLAQIIQVLQDRKLPVQIDIVGRGKEGHNLIKSKKVRFLSYVSEEDLITLYQNADALLLPVTSATANNSALESMACGTPVISNAVGGIPDYVDSSSGWLFPKGEVEDIVDLIEAAISNRKIFEQLRSGARQKSLEFNWEKVSEQVQEVYKRVIQNYLR